MNIKSFYTVHFFIGIMLLLTACGKDEPETQEEVDSSGLEITIHSPSDNSTFSMGDTIILSYTVIDNEQIITIAWDTQSAFGTGSVQGSEFLGTVTEYSGDFLIVADAAPGAYTISINATDKGFENVKTESINVTIQ